MVMETEFEESATTDPVSEESDFVPVEDPDELFDGLDSFNQWILALSGHIFLSKNIILSPAFNIFS